MQWEVPSSRGLPAGWAEAQDDAGTKYCACRHLLFVAQIVVTQTQPFSSLPATRSCRVPRGRAQLLDDPSLGPATTDARGADDAASHCLSSGPSNNKLTPTSNNKTSRTFLVHTSSSSSSLLLYNRRASALHISHAPGGTFLKDVPTL